MKFVYDDGGRSLAGYKGSTGDCVTRAIAIATGKPYKEVYEEINLYSQKERVTKRQKRKSSARTGVRRNTIRRYLKNLGWTWVPTMFIGSGCKVHLTEDEIPDGRIICNLSKHIVAVIDKVIYDTSNPSRGGTRCVYGYWIKK